MRRKPTIVGCGLAVTGAPATCACSGACCDDDPDVTCFPDAAYGAGLCCGAGTFTCLDQCCTRDTQVRRGTQRPLTAADRALRGLTAGPCRRPRPGSRETHALAWAGA